MRRCRSASPRRRRCAGSSRTASARIIAADKRWVICGDFNDYRQRVSIGGDAHPRLHFRRRRRERSPASTCCLPTAFAENIVERRPELDRWTLYHTRGPQERHLCQLDYILLSPALARQQRDGACPTSSAAASPGAPSFRRARRSSAFRAPAGTGPRRRTIVRSPSRWTSSERAGDELRHSARRHPAGRRASTCGSTALRIRSSAPTPRRSLPTGCREGGQPGAVRRRGGRCCRELAYRDRRLDGPLPRGPLSRRSCYWRKHAATARRRARLCPCHAGHRRQRAGGDPHGRAHGQSGRGLFRRRLVRAGGFPRRHGRLSMSTWRARCWRRPGSTSIDARARPRAITPCRSAAGTVIFRRYRLDASRPTRLRADRVATSSPQRPSRKSTAR